VKELNHLREELKHAAMNSDDVKEGVSTPEEELKEPGYIIYDAIVETVVNILSSDIVTKSFAKIAESLPEDTTKTLVELLATCMSNSAHHAIMLYDGMLKQELTAQFNNYGNALNNCIATVNAQKGAIEVFRKQIGDLNMEIEDLKDRK